MDKLLVKFVKSSNLLTWLYRKINRVKHWVMDIRSAFFENEIIEKDTPFGFRMKGSNSIHHKKMLDGDFESSEVRNFEKIFGEVDVFVDIGANIGFYTCLARRHMLKVLAVEPLERNLRFLKENIAENGWEDCEIYETGLGAVAGEAVLFGGSSTGASLIDNWAGSSRFFKRTIKMTTLDDLLKERFLEQRILIKIDVEGAEYQVLEGALETIRRTVKPVWIIEVCFDEFHPDGVNPDFQNVFALFWKNGYRAFTADEREDEVNPRDVARWIEDRRCDSRTINYKFVDASNPLST